MYIYIICIHTYTYIYIYILYSDYWISGIQAASMIPDVESTSSVREVSSQQILLVWAPEDVGCQGFFAKNEHIGHHHHPPRSGRSASIPLSSASWPKRAAMTSTGAPQRALERKGHFCRAERRPPKDCRCSMASMVYHMFIIMYPRTCFFEQIFRHNRSILVMTCSWLCLGCIVCWYIFVYKATNSLDFRGQIPLTHAALF